MTDTGRPARSSSFGAALAQRTPAPRVVPGLIALNVAAFALTAAAGAGLIRPVPQVLVQWGSNFGPLTGSGEWWRLLTGAFLHFGVLHLALNMWALWDAGRLAERLFGAAALSAIYVVAAVVGALASVAWNPWVNSAGASGAIFGVFGALLVYMGDRRHGVPFAVMRAHRISLLVFVGYALGFGLLAQGVDNAAHVGGLVAGALLGFVLARPVLPTPRPQTALAWTAAAIMTVGLCAALAAGVRDVGTEYRAEIAFRRAVDAFSPAAQGLLDARERLGRELNEGRRPAPEVAAALEIEAARWGELGADLARTPLSPEAELAPLQTLLARYAERQSAATRLMAEAIRAPSAERAAAVATAQGALREIEAELERELAARKGKVRP